MSHSYTESATVTLPVILLVHNLQFYYEATVYEGHSMTPWLLEPQKGPIWGEAPMTLPFCENAV